MKTFFVDKDIETPKNAGADGFQVSTLEDSNGVDITNKIDVGIIFRDDEHLKGYLSKIFNTNPTQIDIEEL